MLSALRERADLLIDISALTAAELKRLLIGHFALDTHGLRVFVTSLAYRNVFRAGVTWWSICDFWKILTISITCAGLSGCDPEVAARRQRDPDFTRSFHGLRRFLEPLLPRCEAGGKTYSTIAIGGTGGRHRSVFVAERLSARLRDAGWQTGLAHRDFHPGAAGAPLTAGACDAALG